MKEMRLDIIPSIDALFWDKWVGIEHVLGYTGEPRYVVFAQFMRDKYVSTMWESISAMKGC